MFWRLNFMKIDELRSPDRLWFCEFIRVSSGVKSLEISFDRVLGIVLLKACKGKGFSSVGDPGSEYKERHFFRLLRLEFLICGESIDLIGTGSIVYNKPNCQYII